VSAAVAEKKGSSARAGIDAEHERLEELEREAGEAVDPGLQLAPEEIRVKGQEQLSMFDLGGKKAQTASLRLSGGRVMLVDGQAFKKGTTIHFSGVAVIGGVGQQDKTDSKTGQVVSCEQMHVARIVDLMVE
jgi:hypothetical protein